MRIQTIALHSYKIPLINGSLRSGTLVNILDENGNSGWGDIAPLPKWSKETLEDSLFSFQEKRQEIVKIEWTAQNCFMELKKLNLLPSASFGLESALLSIIIPLKEFGISTSALLMGTKKEILEQANLRYNEGYTYAKLKVNNLNFVEAFSLINHLKDIFRLRIDVNRAWSTTESIQFFSRFPLNTFDYVEEPFKNPKDLALFPHPLAIDESFPEDLSLEQMESLPTLKALIYKPTIQGGMLGSIILKKWADKRGISLILSSSFESDLGLAHVASIAHRLSLSEPIGIGTYHFLNDYICETPFQIDDGIVNITDHIIPKRKSFPYSH